MAEPQEELNRNEPATPFKLQKAHERGSVVRSNEVTFALVLVACVACVYGLGLQVVEGMASMLRQGLAFAGREQLTRTSALALGQTLGRRSLATIGPIVFVVWLTALIVAAMQARGVFSAQPLKPDFSRLNPATGFKRVLSLKSLHDLWRTSAKLIVFTFAMAAWGGHHLMAILRMPTRTAPMVSSGLALLGSALVMLTGLVAVFALLDWALNRWEFMRNQRMSKRQIKDEHKEREGDPRIKSRLRELRLMWLKRARELAKVRSADVLLVNPTHYAIALEYRHGEMPSPMITARGAGEMAQRMRAEANRRSVPIVEHPPLARALFALKDSEVFVPERHFDQVARVLRWVYAARGVNLTRGARA